MDSSEPYELEAWPKAEKFKAAAVARLDASIGKILDRLKELKQESNTIVLVTSDTGPSASGGVNPKHHRSAGPFSGSAGGLREGGLRVPLIVWGPGKIKSGEENYLTCGAWDILPTFAETARAQLPENIDGISFLSPLQGRPQLNRHEFLYWQAATTNGLQQAVRLDDWKAVRPAPGQPLELYNLAADIAETSDIATNHPEIVAKMEACLKAGRHQPAKK